MRISEWSSDVCSSDLTGRIVGLGGQLLEQACMDARSGSQWHGRIVSVSVNVSPLQFGDHLLERVDRGFSRSGLAPEQLVLEVTESAALDDTGPAAPVIEDRKSVV